MIKLAKLNNRPEIFHSIQGEGKNLGKPSVFIRLSLCNLYCKWCDTDYTWNWAGTPYAHNNDVVPGYQKFDKDEMMAVLKDEEIAQIVKEYHCNNLVITGGEPLVQQKSLISLLQLLRNTNPAYHIEYETNGTFIPLPEVDALSHQYNVSIKLSNSGVSYEDRIEPEVIAWFAESPKSNFKFVVDTEQDMEEVQAIIDQYKISNQVVYLMPQGSSVESLRAKQNWIVEVCKQYNYNYSDRLHIHIWGAKRGI